MRYSGWLKVPLTLLLIVGCGDANPSGPASGAASRGGPAPVTVSMDRVNPLPADGSTLVPVAEISPPISATASETERRVAVLLRQIQQIRQRMLADNSANSANTGANGSDDRQRQGNLRIVELAAEVLSLTLDRAGQQPEFARAIQQLLEARLQLALHGGTSDIEQLYADVQALNDRDPESVHAAEGIYCLARFAHAKARVLGRDDPEWFENFSRWAREFAARFSEQQMRAVSLLLGAARSCELHAIAASTPTVRKRLMTEAQMCYVALVERFGQTAQGQAAAAVLRRLELPGTRLSQFAGPTLEGGYVDAENFVDQVTVIYFWDSRNPEFLTQLLPLLQQANEASNGQLRFVGVALDDDEALLRTFLTDHSVPGQQIFFVDPAQRSWDSPLVRFWGILRSCTVWLVDRRGVVIGVDIGPTQLLNEMHVLFMKTPPGSM